MSRVHHDSSSYDLPRDQWSLVRDVCNPENMYYVPQENGSGKEFYWSATDELVPIETLIEIPEEVLVQVNEACGGPVPENYVEWRREIRAPEIRETRCRDYEKYQKLKECEDNYHTEQVKKLQRLESEDELSGESSTSTTSTSRTHRSNSDEGIDYSQFVEVLENYGNNDRHMTGPIRRRHSSDQQLYVPLERPPLEITTENIPKEIQRACPVCLESLNTIIQVALGVCRHWLCSECVNKVDQCPVCRTRLNSQKLITLA